MNLNSQLLIINNKLSKNSQNKYLIINIKLKPIVLKCSLMDPTYIIVQRGYDSNYLKLQNDTF